jgi:hypothetical protein
VKRVAYTVGLLNVIYFDTDILLLYLYSEHGLTFSWSSMKNSNTEDAIVFSMLPYMFCHVNSIFIFICCFWGKIMLQNSSLKTKIYMSLSNIF